MTERTIELVEDFAVVRFSSPDEATFNDLVRTMRRLGLSAYYNPAAEGYVLDEAEFARVRVDLELLGFNIT